jgi:hypothetical protein
MEKFQSVGNTSRRGRQTALNAAAQSGALNHACHLTDIFFLSSSSCGLEARAFVQA